MTNLENNFQTKLNQIFAQEKLPKSFAVAVSGGSDSLALTLLLKEFCATKKIKLVAITVDHKMRKSSSDEALVLSKILQKQKISHQILAIDDKKIPNKNIESNLRELRYGLLHSFCKKNKITHLFLGHIEGDIAENFLIRLFRGSGLDGLSSIAESSEVSDIKLIRPLLDFNKDELQTYLNNKKIKWFEDESNKDEKFLRNKIRKFFNQFEEKNLIQKRIKSAADEIAKMRDLLNEFMLREAKKILTFENGFLIIDYKKFTKIEEKIALKILAFILMEVGNKPYKPRLEKLKRFYDFIIQNENHKPRNFYGCMVKKFDKTRLIVYNEKNPAQKITEFKTILKRIF
ncbi:MAG: tRNA lysidine(34) synthetase TilS [Rickettsiales bacterium]|nr:tRNA lysidine(34) synthetase TilS [Rickettsiales bacterium]